MSIFEASAGLIVCIIGTGLLFSLARRKKQKKFIFATAIFFLIAILFAGYLTLAAIFIARVDSGEDDVGIPGQDWRTYRGYSPAGKISEGKDELSLVYFLYDNNQLGFHLDKETRTNVLSVDLNDADDPELSIKNMKLEDMNFDGYNDLRIPLSQAKGKVIYQCYLWDNTRAVFKYSPELSALTGIEVDAAAKVIKSIVHEDSGKAAAKNYRWQNGKLILIPQ